jgi:chemosensory pili system protein ChpA (sensor histidine kinase/response regulator)
MDVVRTTVRRLNGEIAMDTAPGVGTTFTMRLPLTLLVSEALMVRVGPDILAIPLHAVQQVLVARPEWIQPTERGETLPLYVETADVIRLDRVLGLSSGAELDRLPVVVVRGSGRPVAVVVTEILEKEAIVVKSLGPFLEGLWPFAGGTISAEGRVILVLDPTRLLQAVGGSAPARPSFVEPLADASTVTPRPRAVEGRRILLVDDSISVRKHIGHMLEQAGFAVVLAADGVEAQERLAEASVDTVITDLEMPRMNGFELIQELRRRPESRELPIVVLTTRAGSKHLNLARWLGANHYVAKPVDESAFVSLIGSLAASSEPAPSPGAAR